MSERLDKVAELYDEAVTELGKAAAHARTAAEHFRAEDVPRGAAHAWAARGHLLEVQERLDAQARDHARHSQT
jgi:hypothetical protein